MTNKTKWIWTWYSLFYSSFRFVFNEKIVFEVFWRFIHLFYTNNNKTKKAINKIFCDFLAINFWLDFVHVIKAVHYYIKLRPGRSTHNTSNRSSWSLEFDFRLREILVSIVLEFELFLRKKNHLGPVSCWRWVWKTESSWMKREYTYIRNTGSSFQKSCRHDSSISPLHRTQHSYMIFSIYTQ